MLTESLIELELIDRFSTLPGAYGRDIHNLIRVLAGAKLKLLPNLTKYRLRWTRKIGITQALTSINARKMGLNSAFKWSGCGDRNL